MKRLVPICFISLIGFVLLVGIGRCGKDDSGGGAAAQVICVTGDGTGQVINTSTTVPNVNLVLDLSHAVNVSLVLTPEKLLVSAFSSVNSSVPGFCNGYTAPTPPGASGIKVMGTLNTMSGLLQFPAARV